MSMCGKVFSNASNKKQQTGEFACVGDEHFLLFLPVFT